MGGSWLLRSPSAVSESVRVVESPTSIVSGGFDHDCVSSSEFAGSQILPGNDSGTGFILIVTGSSDNRKRLPNLAPSRDRPGSTSRAVNAKAGISSVPRC